MQSFPAVLRIEQSVSALAGAQDSLASINTNLLSPLAIVMVGANNSLYVLHKDSTAPESVPDIIAPAQGGPGRWFLYGAGASYRQAVTVAHADIPPQSSIDSPATVLGVLGATHLIVFNLTGTLPTGVTMTDAKVAGVDSATFRFTNVTGATVVAGSVAIEVALLK